MLETSSLGVLVAGAAVVVSAIMQYLTIRSLMRTLLEPVLHTFKNFGSLSASSLIR